MKILTPFFLCLTLALLSPLSAQNTVPTVPPVPAGDAGSAGTPGGSPVPDQSAVIPQRSIMPTTINHKPNNTPPPAELAAMIDQFFKQLKVGNYPVAYDNFLSGSPMGAQTEKKSLFISKTEEAFGIYGEFTDYELYDNYTIGSNVYILTYLTRHEKQPLRWRFVFYRPDKTWRVINMGFDDVLLDMLD